MDAPEITFQGLSAVANEKYVDGYTLVQNVLRLAILDMKNDFLSVLATNNISTDISNISYKTSVFNTENTWPALAKERGLTLYKAPKTKNRLKKMIIHKVSILPMVDKEDAEVLIYDNSNVYAYPIELTANLINTIEIHHIVQGDYARVLIDGTDLPVATSRLICFTGCSGGLPNDCGYTKGYNGDGEISGKEGFGLGVEFTCECDYESILCDLAKSYVGKLIYLKTRMGLLEEKLMTNRLNNIVVYGKEEAQAMLKKLEGEYTDTWNSFVGGLPNILKKYNSDCLNCRGVKWVVNV